ncbi:MAG: hypothetical protein AAGE52_31745 [Myxococcota bacterium]
MEEREAALDRADAPDLEEAAAALQKRDRAFLFRFLLRVGVALLLGVWLFLFVLEQDVGSCAARGFTTVTEP